MKSFEEYIRLKVNEVPVEVPNELWQGIEARLDTISTNNPSARGSKARWMKTSIVAAVLVMAGGTALYWNSTTSEDETEVVAPQLTEQLRANPVEPELDGMTSSEPSASPESPASDSRSNGSNISQPIVADNEHEPYTTTPVVSENQPIEMNAPREAELSKLPVLSAETIEARPIPNNAKVILADDLEYANREAVPTEIDFSLNASVNSGRVPLEVDFNLAGAVPEDGHVIWQVNGVPLAYDKEAVKHTFTSTGQYDVSVVIRDSNGRIYQRALAIEAFEGSNLEVPTTFTPNGDRINDEYTVKGVNLAEFQMVIYTLQGEQIFQTRNIDEGWNGAGAFNSAGDNARFYVRVKAVGTDGEIYDITKEIIALR